MINNLTEIIIILDRSGSMNSIKSDMEEALNSFIEDQKKCKDKANVTLVQFDDQYREVFKDKPIEDIKEIKIIPRGMTALLDAIGKTINSTIEHFEKIYGDMQPKKVAVVIITDGEENSSKEFTNHQIKKMISKQQNNHGWAFTYLGANQDSFTTAMNIGIPLTDTINYSTTTAGIRNVANSMSKNLSCYRSTGIMSGYSDEDRRNAKL